MGMGEWGAGEGAGLATPTGPVQGVPSFTMSGSMGGSLGSGGAGPPFFGLEELGLSEDELRSKSMQILAESDDMHQQVRHRERERVYPRPPHRPLSACLVALVRWLCPVLLAKCDGSSSLLWSMAQSQPVKVCFSPVGSSDNKLQFL